jgi:hypothetical protein
MKIETRFKEVLRRSFGNLYNLCLEFYLKTRVFSPKNSFNHSVRESMNLPKQGLSVYPYFSIVWTVLARPRNSFRPTESSLDDSHFCNNACEGLHNLFLRANWDIFTWQTYKLSRPAQGTNHPMWRISSSIPSSQPWRFRIATCEFSWSTQGID